MNSIYFCKRYKEEWSGGLIIVAPDKVEAERIFFGKEDHIPANIEEFNVSESGVLYNDRER